jgi:hypothetical protein
MATYLPPGWPAGVHPPGSQDFERTAVAWLLDVVPPDYRLHGVLRRHPAALASLARHHLAACVEGARRGYRTARTELGSALPPHGVDAVLAAYRSEGERLVTTATAVGLVERSLRGETFTPRLRNSRPGQGTAGPPAAAGRPAPERIPADASMTAPAAAGPVAGPGRADSNPPAGNGATSNGAASNRVSSNGAASNGLPAGNGTATRTGGTSNSMATSRITAADPATAAVKKSGTAKSLSNGKAAGHGKRPRNGSTARGEKGRQLAATGDGS